MVGSEVVAFGTEAVANELLKEAEDCGISVNPVITIEENLNFSENTMQENIENPEGEKPGNHNPATSTAEDFQTSEGEPDESREPQWIFRVVFIFRNIGRQPAYERLCREFALGLCRM